MLNPKTQVAFNLKKGSVPVRGDVDLAAANDCMKKGLDILAKGNIIPDTDQLMTEDTNKQLERSVRPVLEDTVDDAGRSAEALRRDHRGRRLTTAETNKPDRLLRPGAGARHPCISQDGPSRKSA